LTLNRQDRVKAKCSSRFCTKPVPKFEKLF